MEFINVLGKVVINPKSSRSYLHNPDRWMLFEFGNYDWFGYYQWLIEKRFNFKLNRPENKPHITLISGEDIPQELWDYGCDFVYENTFTDVQLAKYINTDGQYWWLPARSKQFEQFRTRLGLSPIPYWNFHFTFGRASNKHLAQSKYAQQILKLYDE